MVAKTMEELVSLCKRRGFIFQSNDIYGGVKGLYDYGPMGVELKNNLKQTWWKSMIYERDDVEGLDATILTSPDVLKHSGHEDTFSDPLVDCKTCKSRWRADQLDHESCPECKSNTVKDTFHYQSKSDNSLYSSVLYEIQCASCYMDIPGHLGERNKKLSFEHVKNEWFNKYKPEHLKDAAKCSLCNLYYFEIEKFLIVDLSVLVSLKVFVFVILIGIFVFLALPRLSY